MRPAHGLVHKVHTATGQRQVVQREPCGLAVRVGRGGGQPVDDVLDVVTATTFVGQAHTRVVYLDRVHHRGQPQQGLQLAIYIDTLNVQLVGKTIDLGNRQVTQRELQRPGLEVHTADGDLSAQLVGRDFFRLVLEQRRHGQPAHAPHNSHTTQCPGEPPAPSAASGGQTRGLWGRGGGRCIHVPISPESEQPTQTGKVTHGNARRAQRVGPKQKTRWAGLKPAHRVRWRPERPCAITC